MQVMSLNAVIQPILRLQGQQQQRAERVGRFQPTSAQL
jgi:hypothetical protein